MELNYFLPYETPKFYKINFLARTLNTTLIDFVSWVKKYLPLSLLVKNEQTITQTATKLTERNFTVKKIVRMKVLEQLWKEFQELGKELELLGKIYFKLHNFIRKGQT